MLDTFAVNSATAETCLYLPDPSKFRECAKDLSRFQDVILSLVEVYAEKVLSKDFDSAGGEKVVVAGDRFVKDKQLSGQEECLVAELCRPNLNL